MTEGSEFPLLTIIQTGSGEHPASYLLIPGTLSPEIKRTEREADHSPPASAKVKKMWMCTSTPPIYLHGIVLRQLNTGRTLLSPSPSPLPSPSAGYGTVYSCRWITVFWGSVQSQSLGRGCRQTGKGIAQWCNPGYHSLNSYQGEKLMACAAPQSVAVNGTCKYSNLVGCRVSALQESSHAYSRPVSISHHTYMLLKLTAKWCRTVFVRLSSSLPR
jgi:hypothetical protein